MGTNDPETPSACNTAYDAGRSKALNDYCDDVEVADVMLDDFALPGDTDDPQSILNRGMDADSSMRETREWVYARTVQLITQADEDVTSAKSQAWGEASEQRSTPTVPEVEPDDEPDDDAESIDELLDDEEDDGLDLETDDGNLFDSDDTLDVEDPDLDL